MGDGRDGRGGNGPSRDSGGSVDELLDRAVSAINRGDREAATALAGQVLAADEGNADAEDLLTVPGSGGEIRRLTILFADLVDSTALSGRVEPETYRMLVSRYRDQVLGIVNRYEGHVGSTKGDGLLAVFGHPTAHEDDARRAVLAGLEITREVARLSEQAQRRFGVDINVRVGVHRGLVYLDTAQDDVYGLAANLAARVSGLAPPGAVVVSDAVSSLVGEAFELQARPPAAVKGVEGLIAHHLVLGERADAGRVGVGRGPLVGRDRELAWLAKSWARAQASTLSIPGVVFRGEPGIGKSRLAAAAVGLVEGSGAVVLELIGSPFHIDVGLHPVRALFERRCGIGRSTDPGERLRLLQAEVAAQSLDAVRVVPLLAPVLGIAPVVGYEPVAAEGRDLYELIAAAVQEYLLACVGGAGLLVAEDVQWFDPSTLEVLGSLLTAAQGRLLVVIAGRPGGWLPGGWPVKVFELPPLTDEQADELITALDPSLTPQDRAVVRARGDGIPLYIEQLVRGVREKPADGSAETRVPDALYEPLVARLHGGANLVRVVEAASVIGRDVDRALLCSVVGLGGDEVDDVIDELEDALVLEPWGTDGWRFRHELLREVATEVAPPSVRRGLHAKVADALVHGAAAGGPDWGLVAGHYEKAQRFDAAARAYQEASAAARRRGALAEARTDLTLALAALDRATPGAEGGRSEMALQLERGFLTAAIEGYQTRATVGDFERCLQLCGTDLGDDELVVTLFALAGHYALRADLRRADRVLEALRAGLRHGRPWLRPVIEIGLGLVAWLRGEFDAACAHLERATRGLAAADQQEIDAVWIQPDEPVASAHVYLALVGLVRGDLPRAEAELAQVACRAERLGFPQGPYVRAIACYVEIWLRIEAGQLDHAAVLAADLIGQGQRHGFDAIRLLGGAHQAAVSALATLDTDDLDLTALSAQIATMTTFVDTLRTVGLNIYAAFHDGVVARLLLAAGQPDQARARLDAALRLARDTGMRYYDAERLRLRAHSHTDPDARHADLDAALKLARRQGATLFELRTALDDFELRGEPARAALIEAVGRFPVDSGFPELARARAALDQNAPKTG